MKERRDSFIMVDYKKCPTDKYECHKCHAKKMYPNASEGKVMGYVCSVCGTINYPVKEKLKIEY